MFEAMWMPSTRSVSLSARNLTMPSVSALARARELARKGKVPFLYSIPAALSSSSVLPTVATSGCV